jgi:glucose/arabinose dehydrogenase
VTVAPIRAAYPRRSGRRWRSGWGRCSRVRSRIGGCRLTGPARGPDRSTVVWKGPPAHSEANGGRLAFTPKGRLLVTLGDRDRDRSIRSARGGLAIVPPWPGLTGSIVSVDPNGHSHQTPTTLATGWFNALAVTSTGAVWVADNAVGDDEHLARVDLGSKPQRAVKLPHVAPTGVAAGGENDL